MIYLFMLIDAYECYSFLRGWYDRVWMVEN